MARQRFIKPSFFVHGELYDAEAQSGLPLRVAFAGLWCQCDRRGIFRVKARELKVAILPYDDVDMTEVLRCLHGAGLVQLYVVDGKEYGHIPTFTKHQTFHRDEKPSADPAPSDNGASTVQAPCQHADPTLPYPTLPHPTGSKKRKRASASADALKGGWPAELGAIFGQTPGLAGKTLKPAVDSFGEELVTAAARAYVKRHADLPPDESHFVTLHDFAKRVAYWVEQVRPGGGLALLNGGAE